MLISTKYENLVFREIYWNRPFEFEQVLNFAKSLATYINNRKSLIWEIRGNSHKISYRLGGEARNVAQVSELMKVQAKVEFGAIHKAEFRENNPTFHSYTLKITNKYLPLKTGENENLVRAVLAQLAQAGEKEILVIQLIIGKSFAPENTAKDLPDPRATWWNYLSGNVPLASTETRKLISEKRNLPRFYVAIRIGASSDLGETRAENLLRGLFASLRLLETSGSKFFAKPAAFAPLNHTKILFLPTNLLSTLELANLMLLPAGEEDFRGISSVHPKLISAPSWYQISQNQIPKNPRIFGETLEENPASRKLLNLPIHQNLKHLHIIGPTGSGKTVVMENLVLSDIKNGFGAVVIDPKNELINSICEKIPENRLKDVVILDPTSPEPVGINPFASLTATPELIAENVLNSLRAIIPDFGVYTEEYLTAGLLTLAKNRGSTLLHLPLLFTNKPFREKLTKHISDLYLTNFWANFDKSSEREKNLQLAPLMRRLNVLLMRQSLVGILGQSAPKFDLSDVFTKNKILLVPLNSGLIGETSAQLIASLVISQLWDFTKKRANLTTKNPVICYIDEFQKYLKLSASEFEEMLSMGRSLGLGFCFAHQNLAQLPKEIKETVMTNARSKIVFQLAKNDAADFAKMAQNLDEIDFMSLERFQLYTILEQNFASTNWISGRSFPAGKSERNALELYADSAKNYGRDFREIKQNILDLISQNETIPNIDSEDKSGGTIGRKARSMD